MSDGLPHPETSASSFNPEAEDFVAAGELRPSDRIRRGSAGVEGMMLLKSYQNMHIPLTQVVLTSLDQLNFRFLFGNSLDFPTEQF